MNSKLITLFLFVCAFLSACASPAQTLTPTLVPSATVTLTSKPEPTPTITATPTAEPREWEFGAFPQSPEGLKQIAGKELVKLSGTDGSTAALTKWLNEMTRKEAEARGLWAGWTGRSVQGLVTFLTDDGIGAWLNLALDGPAGSVGEVPVKVVGLEWVSGEENWFYPEDMAKVESGFGEQQEVLLIHTAVLTDVVDENGEPMTLSITYMTDPWIVTGASRKEQHWQTMQACLVSGEGQGQVPVPLLVFSSDGDAFGSGGMRNLTLELDANNKVTDLSATGKQLLAIANMGQPGGPTFTRLRTPEEVRKWQAAFDQGPVPIICAELWGLNLGAEANK